MIGALAGIAIILVVIAIVCNILWRIADERVDYSILREEEQRQRIAAINRTGTTRRTARTLVDADVATARHQLAVARNLRAIGVFSLYSVLVIGLIILILGLVQVFA